VTLVESELSNYRKDVVNERFTQLQFMAVESKRDENDVFILPDGFDKECGPKGSKLSGGQK